MSTDPYTPDEVELIGCYAGAMEEQAGENYATAKADAERGIAKIKADAQRSTARAFEAAEVNLDVIPAKDRELWRGRNEQRAASVASLRARADRLEEEARLACAAGIGTSSERSSK